MEYSFVNGERTEAFKGGRGTCICCGIETIAKCGSIKIHHWAHGSPKHCDPWWENETEWHRTWKAFFPKEWREVVHYNDLTGEKHIADVKSINGYVLEFQNSPMSSLEMKSRESFYKKLIWIVNAQKFINNFFIKDRLPDPTCKLAKEVRFVNSKHPVFLKHEIPYQIHSLQEISSEISENYKGHHLFDWTRSRSVWYEAECEVLFDFGEETLYKLVRYDSKGLLCVQAMQKYDFIDSMMH